ncbi:hypothetical protein ACFMKA_19285, partial [Acinetobacter baumannii]|uniref:hypothetical protein n=1 Tax=Acinetobacter baumannii TaxID=470 RepID=UPI00366FEC63
FWIVVETPRHRSETDRNRFLPVWAPPWALLAWLRPVFGADLGPKSTILGRILKSYPGPYSSAEWMLIDL